MPDLARATATQPLAAPIAGPRRYEWRMLASAAVGVAIIAFLTYAALVVLP